jgi:hypothetical protein
MIRISREILRYLNQNNHIIQNGIPPVLDNTGMTEAIILLVVGTVSLSLI